MTQLEIECFLAIYEYKSISRAAESLYITQPSLSNRLKILEREIGGELFVRQKGNRELSPTNAGKEFYKLALQYQKVINQMYGVCSKISNRLRISSLNSLDTYLLPQVFEIFLQQNPDIELEIQSMELSAASHSIHSRDTDIAFTTGKNRDNTLKQTLVFSEPMVVVCNKNLHLKTSVTKNELLKFKELFVDWSGDFTNWHDKVLGDSHPKITVSTMTHIQQFLESKLCWSIVPVSVATGIQEQSDLIYRVKTDFELPYREVSIVTLPDNENSNIKGFCDCLKQTVAKYIV